MGGPPEAAPTSRQLSLFACRVQQAQQRHRQSPESAVESGFSPSAHDSRASPAAAATALAAAAVASVSQGLKTMLLLSAAPRVSAAAATSRFVALGCLWWSGSEGSNGSSTRQIGSHTVNWLQKKQLKLVFSSLSGSSLPLAVIAAAAADRTVSAAARSTLVLFVQQQQQKKKQQQQQLQPQQHQKFRQQRQQQQ
ncbi:hypothetical protein Efla_001521 [Eimeria flavescens]